MSEETKKEDEVVVEETKKEDEVKTETETPSTTITEEVVRKICEEVIGAFLDKFTPPASSDEEVVKEEIEDLEF